MTYHILTQSAIQILDKMGHVSIVLDKMGLDKMGLDEMGINQPKQG